MRLFTRAVVALPVVLLSSVASCMANRIEVDLDSLVETEQARTAKANLPLDEIFEMPALTFRGFDNEEIVYTKDKATVSTFDDGSQRTVWKGIRDGEGAMGLATLILQENGHYAANFNTETSVFRLLKASEDSYEVQETYWKDYKQSADPFDFTEPGGGDGGAGADAARPSNELSLSGSDNLPLEVESSVSYGTATTISASNRMLRKEDRDLQALITIDVLVIVTNRAYCESSNRSFGCAATESNTANIRSLLLIAFEEANSGMQQVGVNVELRIANIYYDESKFDGRPDSSTLREISTNSAIATLRRNEKADLVAMITAPGPVYFGRTTLGIANLNSWQSASSWRAFGVYTLFHEVSADPFTC